MTEDPSGKVYLVPTPIGNMGDITLRALELLKAVDIIACEDTRHSGQFLKKLDISKRLISYHDFNESSRAAQLVDEVRHGKAVAVITDAGSPGISDPAYRIVRTAIDNGIPVIPLPGANAVIPALTGSGLPTDRFFFEGFLSNKSAARKNRLAKLKELDHTLVFYESPHRIEKTVADILEVVGDRQMCLARELTKIHEEFIRGTASQVLARIKTKPVKGEIVLIVSGRNS